MSGGLVFVLAANFFTLFRVWSEQKAKPIGLDFDSKITKGTARLKLGEYARCDHADHKPEDAHVDCDLSDLLFHARLAFER